MLGELFYSILKTILGEVNYYPCFWLRKGGTDNWNNIDYIEVTLKNVWRKH